MANPPKGICCPRCGCADLLIPNTVRLPGQVRRYRICRYCGKIVRTKETAEHIIEHPPRRI